VNRFDVPSSEDSLEFRLWLHDFRRLLHEGVCVPAGCDIDDTCQS